MTPVGRILNRFSGDMEQIDVLIPQVGLILFTNFFIIGKLCCISSFFEKFVI